MRTYKYLVIFALIACLSPLMAEATMPVIDYTAIAKMIQEYNKLKELYANAQSQLAKAKEIANDAEGHYGFGGLDNGLSNLKNREWSPDTWDDTLKGLSGGNPARYQELLDEYKKNNQTLSQREYQKGTSKDQAADYQKQIAVNQAAQVQASYAFDDIKNHLDEVHKLSQQIDTAANTKAAVDLNSRLITELAYISVQELKMQTVLNQILAEQQSSNIASETAAAKFNKLPDE